MVERSSSQTGRVLTQSLGSVNERLANVLDLKH
jgi:hypothetical protein